MNNNSHTGRKFGCMLIQRNEVTFSDLKGELNGELE